MRGRLIQRFRASIARLDTEATEAAGAYDSVFRQVIRTDADGDGVGVPDRREFAAVSLPCQMWRPGYRDAQRLHALGHNPNVELVLVFHFRDLEAASLVAADGRALIDKGDRLAEIQDITGTTLRTPDPELFVDWVSDRGWGINMALPTRNLLIVGFANREKVSG